MTENQEKWLKNTTDRLDSMISVIFPPRDYEWKAIVDMVEVIARDKARGNEEIRIRLLDVLEKWELKEKKLRKNG